MARPAAPKREEKPEPPPFAAGRSSLTSAVTCVTCRDDYILSAPSDAPLPHRRDRRGGRLGSSLQVIAASPRACLPVAWLRPIADRVEGLFAARHVRGPGPWPRGRLRRGPVSYT